MKKPQHFIKTCLLSGLIMSSHAFAEQIIPATMPNTVPVTQTVTQPATAPSTVATNPNQLNINTASAAEIQDKLVGIGAKKAQAIIEYRTKHGAFQSVEQLKEVSGIGNATLEKNRDRIVLQ
ncbi:ComEA family DNA-binding protein [Haemophilus sputorum]|uniref:ComEA family DNA-binding protein n=1 Tax=Haemophilus sputorum TaxID=1078480 RepID=UPI0028D5A8FB|nr:ComEA family DNA-binding protein [Haemophilus sputorum]